MLTLFYLQGWACWVEDQDFSWKFRTKSSHQTGACQSRIVPAIERKVMFQRLLRLRLADSCVLAWGLLHTSACTNAALLTYLLLSHRFKFCLFACSLKISGTGIKLSDNMRVHLLYGTQYHCTFGFLCHLHRLNETWKLFILLSLQLPSPQIRSVLFFYSFIQIISGKCIGWVGSHRGPQLETPYFASQHV